MAFGKLTILGEGDDVGEVELTRPTTSIGRQPGNDIVLNTSAVSRYHAQFDVAEGKVFLVDLGTVNGTFVNDRQIEPNSRVPLSDGDVIMMGDMQLIFQVARAHFRAIDIEASLAPSTTVFEDPRLPMSLIVDEPQQPVAPGSHLPLALIINNHADVDHVFTIEAAGIESEWVKINRREVHLEPNEQTEVMFSIRPPRSSSTRPGLYPLTIRVSLKADPGQAIEATREIEIAGYAGVAVASNEGKQNGHYHLAVQNQGNIPLDLQLGGYQRERLLRYHFSSPRLHLEPAQTAQVDLSVRLAGGRPFGQTRRISFAIVIRSLDKAGYQAPIPAAYIATPSWPTWLAGLSLPLMLSGGLATLAVVAALVVFGIVPMPFIQPGESGVAAVADTTTTSSPAPSPTFAVQPTAIATPVVNISDFQVWPGELDFGMTGLVTFTWQIDEPSNVLDYALSETTTGQMLDVSPENWSTGRLALPVGMLVSAFGWDRHEYTLTVTGSDGIDRSSTTAVMIRPIVCLLNENASILSQPDDGSSAAPGVLPPSLQVAVGGRTSDGEWLQIWDMTDHLNLGWVQSQQVTCSANVDIEQMAIVEAGPSLTATP